MIFINKLITMRKFGFFALNDKDMEIINSGYFKDEQEAFEIFALVKKLSIWDFATIYGIIELS
jgi:hypothetical protein